MKDSDLSFIIPIYNMGNTLPDALESVSKVTGIFFEVVLINDGSTDQTAGVVDAFRKKMNSREEVSVKILSVSNSGRGAARNLGVRHASGKYISFLDADDTIDSKEFLKLWKCADMNNRNYDLVIGQFKIVGENGETYTRRALKPNTTSKQLLNRIALSPFSPIHMNAMLIKRTLFDRIDEFDTKNINAEDKDVTIQLLKAADTVTICQSVHYLYHKHQIGRLKTAKKRLQWLWFRQKSLYSNYSGWLRILSMILQANYDVVKLVYEMILGYRGRRG
jgi:glycosyltransferase involved in cell wall biosynthesis